MGKEDLLAQEFEANRGRLRGVAYRMLGSVSEAEDMVQEAWVRLSRSDTGNIETLSGWLTTVVARLCLDQLRSRKSRREEPLDTHLPESDPSQTYATDPEEEALLADSVGPALLVLLETLAPAERLAFVLHDLFGMSFDEIAPIVERSPAAARQLASRARRRVQGASADGKPSPRQQREVVEAFLAASRGGDFAGLLALLDPDVVLRADATAVLATASKQAAGAPKLAPQVRGAAAVADAFSGRARVARVAMLDGAAGAVFAPGGKPRTAFAFTIERGRITGIEVIADPARLSELDVELLEG